MDFKIVFTIFFLFLAFDCSSSFLWHRHRPSKLNRVFFKIWNCHFFYYTFVLLQALKRYEQFWILVVLALCAIFTILVSFLRDNALFASKAKINVFWHFLEQRGPEEASGVKANSALSRKNETKFVKIIHSAIAHIF